MGSWKINKEFMQYFRSIVFVVFGCLFLAACSTAPVAKHDEVAKHDVVAKYEESESALAAKRFLRNVGIGPFAMASFKRSMEEETADNPGLAEISQKVFADVKEEDFVSLAAGVYSRHISHEDLIELGNFSESPTIQRFFGVVFDRVAAKQPVDNSIFKQFNAEEIMEIMRFSASDSYTRMSKVLPVINEEMYTAGTEYGKELFIRYMKNH